MVEYGWDQTPTPDLGLDITKAPEDIQKLYKWVIQKTYGEDVASAYAQGLVAAGIVAQNAEALSLFTSGRMDELTTYVDDMLLEMTDKDIISAPEIIQARGGKTTLGERLDETDAQLEQTDNEIIQARGGKATLGQRLDDTTAQLANITRYYTPEMFGAVGDGVTDDTEAMQMAINSGNHVVLDNKVYKINNTLVIDHGVKITGVNPQRRETNRPYLDFSSCESEKAIHIQFNGVHFEGFNIKGNRSLTTGVYANNQFRFNFTNLGIYYCKYGFNFNRVWNVLLNHCVFEFNDTCMNLDGINTSYSMINTLFYSSKNGFVSNQELDYSSMTSCGFDHCDTGILLESSYANSLTLINCGFEDYIIACRVIGDSQLNIIGFTCVNTARSTKTFSGMGKVTYIGGRSDFLLLPDKKDVVFISPILPTNANIRDVPVSIYQYTNNLAAYKYNIVDTIYSVSNTAHVYINRTSDAHFFNLKFDFISNDGTLSLVVGFYGGKLFVPQNDYCNVTTTETGFKVNFTKEANFRVTGYLFGCKFK